MSRVSAAGATATAVHAARSTGRAVTASAVATALVVVIGSVAAIAASARLTALDRSGRPTLDRVRSARSVRSSGTPRAI